MISNKASFELIYAMEIDEAVKYIEFLTDKELDEKLYLRWIAGPQYQMSFLEFREALMPKKIESEEVILEEVYNIIENFGGEDL